MKIIDDRDAFKKKAVREDGSRFFPKAKKEVKTLSPEEQQVQALQSIAEMIKAGLAQKESADKISLHVINVMDGISRDLSENNRKMIVKILEKFETMKPVNHKSASMKVEKIQRDHRSIMTGFEAKIRWE